MHVFTSVVVDAPIDKVWAAVREFDGVANWNPGVSAARMESGTSTEIGAIRYLDIPDGSFFRETLLEHSNSDYLYKYDIVEGPLPCTNYVSTNRYIPITDGDKTLGIWEGTVDCAEKHKDMLRDVVGKMIYRNGMRGLNDLLAK
ncbi:MAG: SRPBCC family protein [Pseudomonadota bacterium]